MLDLATRAAMLQREVEAVARMDHLPSNETSLGAVLNMMRGAHCSSIPWSRNAVPKSPMQAQRRDISRDRAEQRVRRSPIAPRNSFSRNQLGLERNRSAMSLAESSVVSSPRSPNIPGSSGESPSTVVFPFMSSILDPEGDPDDLALYEKDSSKHGSGLDLCNGLDLANCVSLLDDEDLAGLAEAEAALAMEDRARRLILEVEEAANKSLRAETNRTEHSGYMPPTSQPQHSPLAPLPLTADSSCESAFLGVELSFD